MRMRYSVICDLYNIFLHYLISGTIFDTIINPLNAELNPICHLLALLGAHHIFHVSGLRVNQKT